MRNASKPEGLSNPPIHSCGAFSGPCAACEDANLPKLRVQRVDAWPAGECNFCSRHDRSPVTQVGPGDAPNSLYVRFCDMCLRGLKEQT